MRSFLMLAFSFLCFGQLLAESVRANGDSELARVASEGYLNNRGSIECFRCSFVVRVGEAESVERAKEGDITPLMSANGMWLFRSPASRYELICDPEETQSFLKKEDATGGIRGIPIASRGYLSNGEYDVTYDPITRSATVSRPSESKIGGRAVTPFDMGIMGKDERRNPGRLIQEWLAGGRPLTARYVVGERGEGLILVEFHSADRVAAKYVFAPERGYLPVEFAEFGPSGQPIVQMFMTESRPLKSGNWFPGRSVVLSGGRNDGNRFGVREIVTELVDDDVPPRDDELMLELVKGTRIDYLAEEGRVRVSLKEDLSVPASKIGELPKKSESIAEGDGT